VDEAVARQRLHDLLADLDRSTTTIAGELGDTGELSRVDQHPAEAASELIETERDEAMLAVVDGQRGQVREALARLDAGTYGTCVACGTTLPDERLEARPEAARCVNCQQDMEMAR
jgi:DnaK suppressor protein